MQLDRVRGDARLSVLRIWKARAYRRSIWLGPSGSALRELIYLK